MKEITLAEIIVAFQKATDEEKREFAKLIAAFTVQPADTFYSRAKGY